MRGEWAEKVGGRHRSGGSGGRENWERKRKQKELGGMRKKRSKGQELRERGKCV